MQIIEFHFGEYHLNHDLRWLSVQTLHKFHDLIKVSWRGADDERISDGLGNDDHFGFNLCKRILSAWRCLIDDSFAAQKIIDGIRDVESW